MMASAADSHGAAMGETEMEMYHKLAIRPLPARSRPSPADGSSAGAARPTAPGVVPDMDAGSVSGGEEDLDFQPPPGAKKRKTPACPVVNGRHDVSAVYDGDVVDGTNRHSNLAPIMLRPCGDDDDDDDDDVEEGDGEEVTVPKSKADTKIETMKRLVRNHARSTPTRTCDHRKILFLRRKAALITLFLDATAAIKSYWKDADDKSKSNSSSATAAAAATATASKALLSKLPEVDAFEKLLPALEDVGPCDWPPDRPDWRSGVLDKEEEEERRLGVWRTGFAKRRKLRDLRKGVVRGGWAPEGSFEFERSSKAGNVSREGARARASLQRLAHELRHILLTIKPKTSTTSTTSSGKADESSPSKTKRRTCEPAGPDASSPAATPASQAEANATAPGAGELLERTGSRSKEGSEVGSGVGGKKKPKKKKRSVLANQSNPHHVDNYRPTRTVTPATDPNEPYPHHASLLFPPSMAFLSARPGTQQRVRASEDDFICAFCEYDLFYGTDRQRRAAIRSRKQELRRKANIKNKAKSVADGKRKEESEYDDEDDGEGGGEECEDQGYGKCSCGRALGPHGDKEHHLKPPDPDPNIDPPLPPMHLGAAPAMPRLPALQDIHLEGGDLSRASTPSID